MYDSFNGANHSIANLYWTSVNLPSVGLPPAPNIITLRDLLLRDGHESDRAEIKSMGGLIGDGGHYQVQQTSYDLLSTLLSFTVSPKPKSQMKSVGDHP